MNVPVEGSTLFVKQVRGDNIYKLIPVGDKVGLKSSIDQHGKGPEPRSRPIRGPPRPTSLASLNRPAGGLNRIHAASPFQYLLVACYIWIPGKSRTKDQGFPPLPILYHDYYTSLLLLRLRFKDQSLPHVDVPSSVLDSSSASLHELLPLLCYCFFQFPFTSCPIASDLMTWTIFLSVIC
jgi:hypothetical protein